MYRHQLGENLLWSHLGLKAKGLSGLRYVMLCYFMLRYVILCMLPPFAQNYPSHLHARCLAAFSLLRKIMKLVYTQTIVIIVQWLWTLVRLPCS